MNTESGQYTAGGPLAGSRPKLREFLPVALLLALTFLLSITGITQENLWFDEFFSVRTAMSLPELIRTGTLVQEIGIVPLFYFFLLRIWSSFLGYGMISVRMLSVVFAMSTVYALYALGRRLLNQRAGLIAGFLFAIQPAFHFHSQDARHYMLFAFLTILLFILFDLYVKTPKRPLLAAVSLAEVLLANTHFFGVLIVLVVQMLFVLFGEKKRIRDWVRSQAIVFVVLLGCLFFYTGLAYDVSRRISQISATGGLQYLGEIVSWISYGGREFAERDIFIPPLTHIGAPAVMTLLMLVGAWRWSKQGQRGFWTAMLWLFVPLTVLIVVSLTIRRVILQRHIFNLTPVYLLFIAAAIDWLWHKQRILGGAVLAVVVITLLPGLEAQIVQTKRFPVEALAEEIREIYRPGDVLLVSPDYTHSYLAYFFNPQWAASLSMSRPTATQDAEASAPKDGCDIRFWLYLQDAHTFNAIKDVEGVSSRRQIYIMTRIRRFLRFLIYYPRSMYPDRILMVNTGWVSDHLNYFQFMENKILLSYYRIVSERVVFSPEVYIKVYERNGLQEEGAIPHAIPGGAWH